MRHWLRDARQAKGLSQEETAKRTGVSQSTYAMWETGTRTPTVETAKRIADVLGFSWTRFFDDEEVR